MRPTKVLDRTRSTSRNNTIHTAVAPKAVITMRTLATRAAPAPEFVEAISECEAAAAYFVDDAEEIRLHTRRL
jgi:hypothetical protein